MTYLIEEWKLKRCICLYHWFVIGITFSYVKKIFGSVVSLHYENTLFIFLFHLEGKLPIKTASKFQRYYPILIKVTYLLPKLSTVGTLITFNITNKSYIWWFLLKGNPKLDILFGVILCCFKTQAFFLVILCRRFRLLLINTYVKSERCISSFSREIALKRCPF